MQLSKISISNFLSIEFAELEFKEFGLWLVDGWNFDMGRANAAGKTAICNAISFALYGKIPRKITASDILRTGSKSGYVELELESNGTIFKVRRERPNKVTFWQDSTELPLSQDDFETKIKIKYDQFLAVMYFAQGYSGRFISLNDSEKKDFLIKLLNLDSFSKYKAAADDELKILNKQKEAITSKINELNTKIQTYEESLVDDVEIYRAQLQVLDKAIEKCMSEVHVLGEIPKPSQQTYKAEEAKLDALLKEEVAASAQRPLLLKEHQKLSAQLSNFKGPPPSLSCPECASSVVISAGKLIPASQPVDHSHEKAEITKQMEAIKLNIDFLDEIIRKSESYKIQKRDLYSAHQEKVNNYTVVQGRIADFKAQAAKFTNKRESISEKLSQQADIRAKIETAKAQESAQKVTLGDVLLKSDLFSTMSTVFSATGAQAYVLDSTIDALNAYIKSNIAEIWNNISYQFLTTKENSKGEVIAKFSEELVMDGEEKALGSLSGGEYRALSIAVDFAVVDLLSNFLGIRISPIILDEPFDGLDIVGKETVIELLEKMAIHRQIFVIDHSAEVRASFADVIRVEKRSGVSTLV